MLMKHLTIHLFIQAFDQQICSDGYFAPSAVGAKIDEETVSAPQKHFNWIDIINKSESNKGFNINLK